MKKNRLKKWLRHGKRIEWLDHHGQWIVVFLLVVSTALWLSVFDKHLDNNSELKSHNNVVSQSLYAIYYSLQFITLSKNLLEVKESWQLYFLFLIQFVIPLFTYSTLFTKIFHDRIIPFLKREEVKHYSNHHVIFGYGAFGQALAKELLHNKEFVVAIDLLDFQINDLMEATLLCCDAVHSDIIDIANLESAKSVYLFLPKEVDNLLILKKIAVSNSIKNNLQVFVRAESGDIQRLISDWVGFKTFYTNSSTKKNLDIRSCNPIHIAARGILNCYSPDKYDVTDTSGLIAQVVMVVGTSEAAKAIILRFARIGIFSPKGKLLLIWAGEGVTKAFQELKSIYPALDTDYNSCNYWGAEDKLSKDYFDSLLPPIKLRLMDFPSAQATRQVCIYKTSAMRWPSVIYMCHDSDIRNLSEARDLQTVLCAQADLVGKPERLIIAVQSKSAWGIGDNTDMPYLRLMPYQIKEVCLDYVFATTIANDRADELAKCFDSLYRKRWVFNDNVWDQTKFLDKESNRDVADHLAIKARYAGINSRIVTKCVFEGAVEISDDDRKSMQNNRNDLVVMEMLRYRAFMFMNGFTHGSYSAKYNDLQTDIDKRELNRCLRINDTLLKENLPKNEHEKDEDIVDYSLEALSRRIDLRLATDTQKVLDVYELKIRKDHAVILKTLDKLERLIKRIKKVKAVELLLLRVKEMREKVLIGDNPVMLINIDKLALLLYKMGDYEGAVHRLHQAKTIRKQLLRTDNVDLCTNLIHLASLLWSLGDHEGAKLFYQEALNGYGKASRKNHHNTLTSLSLPGSITVTKVDTADIETMFRWVLDIQEKESKKDEPYKLINRNNLALLLMDKGDFEGAEPFLQRAVNGRKRELWLNHPDTLTSMNNLGVLFEKKGNYDQAESQYLRALKGRKQVLGKDHPNTLASQKNLDDLLKKTGE